MEMADAYPDIIIGCVGGGSNFAGQFLPWIRDKISDKSPICALFASSWKAVLQ
jgi:tryptophan synthase beta chain